jgi:hypothetical protein
LCTKEITSYYPHSNISWDKKFFILTAQVIIIYKKNTKNKIKFKKITKKRAKDPVCCPTWPKNGWAADPITTYFSALTFDDS